MLNPDDLVQAWVDKFQSITSLMDALGQGGTVSGYTDQFPDQDNLRRAILKQPAGSILVVWMGMGPRKWNQALYFQHRFQFLIKAAPGGDGSLSYAQVVYQIVNGVDPDTELKLLHSPIHPLCEPMDLDLPSASRQSLLISTEGGGETMDYFEFTASLMENVSDTQ